jgi:hypothetical protein
MMDKAHLRDKTVMLRMVAANRTLSAVVSHVEDDGIWLLGGDFVNQLAAATGGLPAGRKSAAVYVPFSQIVWMIAPNE